MAKKARQKKPQKRSDRVLVVRVKDLQIGLENLSKWLPNPAALKEIHVILPDISFLFSLLKFDDQNAAVNTILEAWSIGVTTKLSVHFNLLKMLSPESLVDLPSLWTDQNGKAVIIHSCTLIDYADVALLDNCFVMAPTRVLVTDLAAEHMNKRNVQLIKRKQGYVSG
ncbi:PduM family microcompartment protein [Thaumasiovibrio sp. DFM-14]|uniref:PduM family microcompartment protein n=1 Tax=Thaumasiovibrio sp. DFM-14 TaxID=3384792 RepID=UPI0039A254BF